MKINLKTVLFLLVTLYIIPGIVLFFVERSYMGFYFIAITTTTIPYYIWGAHKKLSCKILGYEFRF